MKQHVPEKRLALYVTGDLEAGEIERIGGHLNLCEDCPATVAELEETLSIVATVADEPQSEALLEVRNQVLSRLKQRQGLFQPWKWAAGAAAVAAIALVCFVGYRPAVQLPAVPAPQIETIVPALHSGIAAVRQPVPARHRTHRRPAPGIQSVTLIDQPDSAPLIKIATTDPNVVILLASDERTKSE